MSTAVEGHRRPRWRAAPALLALGGLLLAACSGSQETGPPSARVDSWLTASSGGSSVGTLSVDSRNVGYVLAHRNSPSAVRTVCALLDTDAQKGIGQLPTPDPALTTALLRAYQDAASAGTDCYDGASGNTALLSRSAKERSQLPQLLDAALARIRALTGHTPSTSTTAPTDGGGDPFGGG
jgi:hypothetical protein